VAAQKIRYSLRSFSPNIWSLSCICIYIYIHIYFCIYDSGVYIYIYASLEIENSCFLEWIFIDKRAMRSSYYYVQVFDPHSNSLFHTIPQTLILVLWVHVFTYLALYFCTFVILFYWDYLRRHNASYRRPSCLRAHMSSTYFYQSYFKSIVFRSDIHWNCCCV